MYLFLTRNLDEKEDKKEPESEVAAVVNGEKIYLKDIEKIYKRYAAQGKTAITRKTILQNSINEILVIQEAQKKGIVISDSEVNGRIEELKIRFPQLYDRIIKEIGLEKYRSILKKRMMYQKMKEYVLKEQANDLVITDYEAYEQYLKNKGLWDESLQELDPPVKYPEEFERTKEDIKKSLRQQKEREIFDKWVNELRKKSDIKVFMK